MKCQRCEATISPIGRHRCTQCDRVVCANCYAGLYGLQLCVDCHDKWTEAYQERVTSAMGGACPICGSTECMIVDHFVQWSTIDPPSVILSCKTCGTRIDGQTVDELVSAHKAMESGRYEDAASVYERLGYVDKAKGIRDKSKTKTVKHVDINRLLEQIKHGNFAVPYRCPTCGGNIRIGNDSTLDRLANCPYCGSSLKIIDIEKFLSSAL